MPRNISYAQDVWKDAGQNVSFATFMLDRKDRETELEGVRDFIEKYQALGRSLKIRAINGNLKMALGFSRKAWDYLFPDANVPKELETFTGLKGEEKAASMPATAGDIFLHIRANDSAVVFEAMYQCKRLLAEFTEVVDEDRGFRYFEGRAIIGFIDGTEAPVDQEAIDSALIGDEDPEFINGSYLFAQKWIHDMPVWENMTTEEQEKGIGRNKFNDLELEDDEKYENAHNVSSQYFEDGEEKKIIRMNVPFTDTHTGEIGTYFMGYSGAWHVTLGMMQNMIDNVDFLLTFSKVISGQLYFIPSITTLDAIAEGEI